MPAIARAGDLTKDQEMPSQRIHTHFSARMRPGVTIEQVREAMGLFSAALDTGVTNQAHFFGSGASFDVATRELYVAVNSKVDQDFIRSVMEPVTNALGLLADEPFEVELKGESDLILARLRAGAQTPGELDGPVNAESEPGPRG